MKQNDRAKQFMPFAALSGYEELIEEQTHPAPKAKNQKADKKLKSTKKEPYNNQSSNAITDIPQRKTIQSPATSTVFRDLPESIRTALLATSGYDFEA